MTFRRRFWKEGTVRNKSQKSKRYLQDLDQQKSTFSRPNACAVRRDVRRWKRREDDRASWIIVLPETIHFLDFFFTLFIFIHSKNIVNWGIAINNVIIVSGEQQRDLAIHIHVPLLP